MTTPATGEFSHVGFSYADDQTAMFRQQELLPSEKRGKFLIDFSSPPEVVTQVVVNNQTPVAVPEPLGKEEEVFAIHGDIGDWNALSSLKLFLTLQIRNTFPSYQEAEFH